MTARRRRPLVRQAVRVAGLAGAAALVALLLTSASTSAPSGLVAAYAFDEGSGSTVSDASGNGNAGTISGATWTSAGKYGSALSFNGSSSRVTIANASSLQLSSGMTLEAWVNPATVSSAWRDVIEKGNDNYFLMGTTDHSSAAGGGGIIGGSYGQVFTTSPLADQHLVVPRPHLRRRHRTPLPERHPGGEPRPHRRDHQLHQRAHARQRSLLRPVLQRPDRQHPHLQQRALGRGHPNRHDDRGQRYAGHDPALGARAP